MTPSSFGWVAWLCVERGEGGREGGVSSNSSSRSSSGGESFLFRVGRVAVWEGRGREEGRQGGREG